MAIDYDLIKFYQCEYWGNSRNHGGDISDIEIESGKSENIFSNVSDENRKAGSIDYKKIFIRNENASVWHNVVAWIEADTPAPNDSISIHSAGTKSRYDEPVELSGLCTIRDNYVIGDINTNFTKEVSVGERVYNGSDDTIISAVEVSAVYDQYIVLSENYPGTPGVNRVLCVAPAKYMSFVSPLSKNSPDRIVYGDIAPGDYVGMWIKRTVLAAGSYYIGNRFILALDTA